jgi:hypothetical protein
MRTDFARAKIGTEYLLNGDRRRCEYFVVREWRPNRKDTWWRSYTPHQWKFGMQVRQLLLNRVTEGSFSIEHPLGDVQFGPIEYLRGNLEAIWRFLEDGLVHWIREVLKEDGEHEEVDKEKLQKEKDELTRK